ncbi:MAG: hypothetical protein WC794_04470 [Candidatus Doudnabacteria bacterium]|jgi:hypothetical protein
MNKKNIPLIIALCIPVLMIIVLAMAIYLPGLGKKPAHNFIYLTGDDYYSYGQSKYMVNNGYLIENPSATTTPPPYYKPVVSEPRIFLYNVATNSAMEITFDQASKYRLDPSQTSVDGYIVERGNSNGDFLFGSGGSDYNSWFIKGHNRSAKLDLKLNSANYYNMQFLGWVQ